MTSDRRSFLAGAARIAAGAGVTGLGGGLAASAAGVRIRRRMSCDARRGRLVIGNLAAAPEQPGAYLYAFQCWHRMKRPSLRDAVARFIGETGLHVSPGDTTALVAALAHLAFLIRVFTVPNGIDSIFAISSWVYPLK